LILFIDQGNLGVSLSLTGRFSRKDFQAAYGISAANIPSLIVIGGYLSSGVQEVEGRFIY